MKAAVATLLPSVMSNRGDHEIEGLCFEKCDNGW